MLKNFIYLTLDKNAHYEDVQKVQLRKIGEAFLPNRFVK